MDRGAEPGGDAAAAAAAAAAVDMERGAEEVVGWLGPEEGWVVCLFGCWEVEALAREEGFWRKAAKKVERKKGRCEDMLVLIS